MRDMTIPNSTSMGQHVAADHDDHRRQQVHLAHHQVQEDGMVDWLGWETPSDVNYWFRDSNYATYSLLPQLAGEVGNFNLLKSSFHRSRHGDLM